MNKRNEKQKKGGALSVGSSRSRSARFGGSSLSSLANAGTTCANGGGLLLTDAQNVAFALVRDVLRKYKNSTNEEGLRVALGELGYCIARRRVTWSGGVGSFRVMRGGIARVQVRASVWGCRSVGGMYSGGRFVGGSKVFGLKYAPCVEILPTGKGYWGDYYRSGKQPQRARKLQRKRGKKIILQT